MGIVLRHRGTIKTLQTDILPGMVPRGLAICDCSCFRRPLQQPSSDREEGDLEQFHTLYFVLPVIGTSSRPSSDCLLHWIFGADID